MSVDSLLTINDSFFTEQLKGMLFNLQDVDLQQQIKHLSAQTNRVDKYLEASAAGEKLRLSRPIVIALSGLPRSGKDYLSQFFWDKYWPVAVIPYSSLMINEINHFLKTLSLNKIDENNKSVPQVRNFIIAWANRRREQEQDYWTKQLVEVIDQRINTGTQLVFLPGARFQSDIDCLNPYDHYLWKIVRPENDYCFRENNDSLPYDQLIINDDFFVDNADKQLKQLF
jgi:hypothetical protein